MKSSFIKKHFTDIFFYAMLFAALIFCITVAFTKKMNEPYISRDCIEFDTGWYSYNEAGEKIEVQVPRTKAECSDEGYTIYNKIPLDLPEGYVLQQLIRYNDAYAYINGVLRASFDDRKYRMNERHSITGCLEIPLTQEDAGAEISIKYVSSYNMTKGRLEQIYLGYSANVKNHAVFQSIPAVLSAVLILFIGIMITIGGVYLDLSRKNKLETSITYLGVSMILYSMDPLYGSYYLQCYIGNTYIWYLLYRFSSFLVGIPLLLFFNSWQKRHYNKWILHAVWLNFIICAISVICQLAGFWDFVELQSFKNVGIAISFLTILVTCIMEGINGNKEKMKMMLIPSIVICTAFVSIIFLNYVLRNLDSFNIMYPATLLTFLLIGFVALKSLLLESQRAIWQNRAKTEFLAMMSHDIRTPINAVLGMDEMILRESNEYNVREYAENIKSAGQVLLSLISDILDMSKLESGRLEIISSPYKVEPFIDNLVNMIQPQVEKKGLQFEIKINPEIPTELVGDEISLTHVVSNLLTNAMKYTQKGSITLTFDMIEDMKEEIVLLISVQDTGIGIKEEDKAKIFEKFQRVDETKNAHIEGTGLGLSIAVQFLRLMGSHIELESIYGEGTKFFFKLRQKVNSVYRIGEYVIKDNHKSGSYPVFKRKFAAPLAKVLVVDDSRVNLLVFRSLLSYSEMTIDSAESGEESLEYAKKRKYDIIFMDHQMPGMDGIEAMLTIKKMDGSLNKETPIIVLTANTVTDSRKEYIERGFDNYLSKPLIPDQLDEMIMQYLPKEYILKE